MSNVQADTGHREIIFHDDEETPLPFVIELLHSVFKKQLADALRFTEAIRQEGKASCGSYPRESARELLDVAQQRIDESGHPLRITSRAAVADDKLLDTRCRLCGDPFGANQLSLKGGVTLVCDECMNVITSHLPEVVSKKRFEYACDALAFHFAGIPPDRLVATSRQFPGHMRADVQAGVDKLFSASPLRFFGIHEEHRYETLSLAALSRAGRNAHAIAPAQYHDVDVGESAPVKCLRQRPLALPNRRPALRRRALLTPGIRP
jgi:ATP-dependent Clp protease adapter protein ClpS